MQKNVHPSLPALLIPEFLADDATPQGSFTDLGRLFLDLSGLTTISSQLSPHGKRGAEELSAIINRVFAPLVAQVYLDSGYISGFAGDACAAVFPGQPAEAVLRTAFRPQTIVRRQQLQSACQLAQDSTWRSFTAMLEKGYAEFL